MSEPFLDTDYVRNEFIRGAYSEREMSLEFDRWLDQVKADAWDEGFKQGGPMHDVNYDDPDAHTRNPYRDQEKR